MALPLKSTAIVQVMSIIIRKNFDTSILFNGSELVLAMDTI